MYKLLIDSDALIKLAKIGLLDDVTRAFNVEITEEICNETVMEGKKRLYEDADKIKEFVDSKRIVIIKDKMRKIKSLIKENLGSGELSIINSKKRGHIIVTDDFSFTKYLQIKKIIPISSANLIFALKEKSILTKQQAEDSLEKLKPYIRNDIYINVKNDMGGE